MSGPDSPGTKSFTGGVRVKEFLKSRDLAVFERDHVDEVRFIFALCGSCKALRIAHNRNHILIGQKLSWLEHQNLFGFATDIQPFDEPFMAAPQAPCWIERILRLTPLHIWSEHRQNVTDVRPAKCSV